MANKNILEYLRETPHNTNVNVVKGMVGNNSSGSIKMTTVFEDDIILTYTGNGYSIPSGKSDIGDVQLKEYVKITLDNQIIKGVTQFDSIANITDIFTDGPYKLFPNSNYNYGISLYYETNDNLTITIVSYELSNDPDLEAYCQTPHHLKIEWFTI